MTIPQTKPQTDDALAALERDIGRALDRSQPAATHPPAFRQPPAPSPKWGPSNPPADHLLNPLQLLAGVADKTHALQEQIRGLKEAITGESAGPRTRAAAKLPTGLLPAIAFLAHEIDEAQAEVGRVVADLKERLR